MTDHAFFQSQTFYLVIIPILIFLGRIIDVTVGTMRIIFVSRGLRFLSVAAGFVEILVWLLAIRQIMANLDHWSYFIAYAAGFSTGNYIGITIERHLALGYIILRVITQKEAPGLERYLRNHDFMMTVLDARGDTGPVKVFFMVIRRKALGEVLRVIKKSHPLAFYTIEDVRYVSQGLGTPLSRRHTFLSRRNGKAK